MEFSEAYLAEVRTVEEAWESDDPVARQHETYANHTGKLTKHESERVRWLRRVVLDRSLTRELRDRLFRFARAPLPEVGDAVWIWGRAGGSSGRFVAERIREEDGSPYWSVKMPDEEITRRLELMTVFVDEKDAIFYYLLGTCKERESVKAQIVGMQQRLDQLSEAEGRARARLHALFQPAADQCSTRSEDSVPGTPGI